MKKQEITREELMSTIDNLNKVSLIAASGGGTDWDFLTFESDLDDDNNYHYFDVSNLGSYGYEITYQFKNNDDDEFGEDTITTFTAYTLQDIVDFHNDIF